MPARIPSTTSRAANPIQMPLPEHGAAAELCRAMLRRELMRIGRVAWRGTRLPGENQAFMFVAQSACGRSEIAQAAIAINSVRSPGHHALPAVRAGGFVVLSDRVIGRALCGTFADDD